MTKCRSFPLVCGEKGKKGGKEESSPGEKERSHCGRKGQLRGEGNLYKSTKVRTLKEEKGQRTRARTFGSGMALSDDDGGESTQKQNRWLNRKDKETISSPFLPPFYFSRPISQAKRMGSYCLRRKWGKRGRGGGACMERQQQLPHHLV